MSLSLLAAAAEAPDRVALVAGGVSHTFAELAPRVARIAGWLSAQGIRAGDRVALVAGHHIDSLLALHALFELGAPVVPIHPRLTRVERAALLRDAAPALVLDESWSERDASARPLAPRPPEHGCLAIVFTSGTTGRAKGAMLSRAAFAASARSSAANLGWTPDDRWLLCMPLAHVGGLSIVVRCLLARRAVVMAEPGPGGRFEPPAIAEALARDRVTLLSLVPTMLRRLLDREWMPSATLRAVLLGGAAATPALLDEAARRRVPALTTYGLTEACSQVTAQRYGTRPGAEQGAGEPLPGLELRIAGDEIHIRGPHLMTGYLPADASDDGRPFDRDGWFATGDFGGLDERGRLHVWSRRTDLIVSGGENVYPAEVELALGALPGVAGACVFGVPDDTWGQRVAVALVPGPGGPPPDAELAAHFLAHLAPHKRPREIAFIDELPATEAGKLDRAATARLALPRLRPLR